MKTTMNKFILLALSGILLTGCLGAGGKASSKRKTSNAFVSNSASSLDVGYGRILQDNPIVLSNYNWNLAATVDLSQFLLRTQDFLTTNGTLSESCTFSGVTVTNCYAVLKDATSTPLTPVDGKWAYSPSTQQSEWLQTHTFGHMKKAIETYTSILNYSYSSSQSLMSLSSYSSSIPGGLYTSYASWFGGDEPLYGYSEAEDMDNAYFSPSEFTLSFGNSVESPGMNFAEDPSIIYHEIMHAFVHIMANARTVAGGTLVERVDVGMRGYDEAGAINEGLADYFSYVMNDRTFMGEWALQRFFDLGRPMIETDSHHQAGINLDADKRLSYPTYIRYDAQFRDYPIEDVHLTGQIASHYLVALTGDFQSYCRYSLTDAQKNVVFLIAETLMEVGDLTNEDSDVSGIYPYSTYSEHVNLNASSDSQKQWATVVRPMDFRRFFQVFAKNLYGVFGQSSNCNGTTLDQDLIEQRLDQYGLLLFDTYNEDGNGYSIGLADDYGHDGTITAVNPLNRIYTKMINKDLLDWSDDSGDVEAFVVDEQQTIYDFATSLKASGVITSISSLIPSDYGYNNGNGKPSPGEVFGLALNLKNYSNNDMAGVTVLANDWDHARWETDEFRMCNNFDDAFPLDTENAAGDDGIVAPADGECDYVTRENGSQATEANEKLAPVCFMLSRDEDATTWIDQNQFRIEQGLAESECLQGSDETKDCFIRAIPGADYSVFPVIKASKTFSETIQEEGDDISLKGNHVILFELSPWIPPGTTINCRMRARFTNCTDCWQDSAQADDDDYLDYEFSGAEPYKIINFQFTVID